MIDCACPASHSRKRIVLTGGPGAGKTAVLELVRKSLCKHLWIVPESAGLLFGGGFPRGESARQRRSAQRAIYFVQRELEECAATDDLAIALCDRGTVDGAAYWSGPGDLWSDVGTTRAAELSRYAAVIHLRVPRGGDGYDRSNPLRIEGVDEARAIDERIAEAWAGHPRRFTVEAEPDFVRKAARALEVLRAEMPTCCQAHLQSIAEV